MQNKKLKLGPLEIAVMSWVQFKKKSLVFSDELQKPLGMSRQQITEVLSRLKRNGLILRLSRSVYLFPDKLPPGGKWGPDRYWVLDQFMKYWDGTYQITGLEAFIRFGLSDQIPNVTTVYNDRVSGRRKIGSCQYEFIKVTKGRLGGVEKVQTQDGIVIPFPSLARTLVDAIYDWSRFNKMPEALECIRKETKSNHKLVRQLMEAAEQFGNIGTIRRVGFILEYICSFSSSRVNSIFRLLPLKSRSLIPLYPGKTRKGEINTKWGIIINA
jgi:predicted transcriptional regulator of viral defense system